MEHLQLIYHGMIMGQPLQLPPLRGCPFTDLAFSDCDIKELPPGCNFPPSCWRSSACKVSRTWGLQQWLPH